MGSNAENWRTLLATASPAARSTIEKTFGENLPPLFECMRDALSRPGPFAAAVLHNGLLIGAVSNPGVLSLAQAIEVAQAAIRIETGLDYKILSHTTSSARNWPYDIPRQEMMRVLQIIDGISDCRRLVMPLMKFAKLSQPHLRSKAVKLLARASRNSGWADSILSDPDARVRSNMIEGLVEHLGKNAIPMLKNAARDPHHRVAVTALLELARMGDAQSREALEKMSAESKDPHKRAAAWALRRLAKTRPACGDGPTASGGPLCRSGSVSDLRTDHERAP